MNQLVEILLDIADFKENSGDLEDDAIENFITGIEKDHQDLFAISSGQEMKILLTFSSWHIPGKTKPESLSDKIWGSSNEIGAVTGVPRHLNQYCCIPSIDNSTSPRLLNFLTLENVNDVKGNSVLNYEYSFKTAWIKIPSQTADRDEKLFASDVEQAQGVYGGPVLTKLRPGKARTPGKEIVSYPSLQLSNNNGYFFPIEKSFFMSTSPEEKPNAKVPPLLYFGVYPIQSNAPLANKTTFSPGVVMWKIKTKLHLRGSWNFVFDEQFSTEYYNGVSLSTAEIERFYFGKQMKVFFDGYRLNKFPLSSNVLAAMEIDEPKKPKWYHRTINNKTDKHNRDQQN
ncbi:hypothetical protein SSS_05932 [Sarcoptes scabiei]|uniref:Uncharacterized protein n=1 Tax=Sarcoptes scabiei TaxID=52283 RepID=A0A834RJW1_SARSC|nr:hypothetical protein SSS_05932 [Sarcoptes scabiei]